MGAALVGDDSPALRGRRHWRAGACGRPLSSPSIRWWGALVRRRGQGSGRVDCPRPVGPRRRRSAHPCPLGAESPTNAQLAGRDPDTAIVSRSYPQRREALNGVDELADDPPGVLVVGRVETALHDAPLLYGVVQQQARRPSSQLIGGPIRDPRRRQSRPSCTSSSPRSTPDDGSRAAVRERERTDQGSSRPLTVLQITGYRPIHL